MASGYYYDANVGWQYPYDLPDGHDYGDMGSSLDEVSNATTIWSAGGSAEVSYAIWASHGGGIQFRLCPKTAGFPTEACFRTMPLAFATGVSKIRYTDGEREDLVIGAVDVNEGTTPMGSTWYVHRGGRGAVGARPLPLRTRRRKICLSRTDPPFVSLLAFAFSVSASSLARR